MNGVHGYNKEVMMAAVEEDWERPGDARDLLLPRLMNGELAA